jgi:hypothetical protein
MSRPELLIESAPDAVVMRPLGRILPGNRLKLVICGKVPPYMSARSHFSIAGRDPSAYTD